MHKYSNLSTEKYRVANIQLIKDSRGYSKAKAYLPHTWLEDMGIDKDNRLVELRYNKKKGEITIRKFTEEK